MMLVVDIGNTRIKWAHSTGDGLQSPDAFTPDTTEGALAKNLDAHWSPLEAPTRVVACSVAGTIVDDALASWVTTNWSLTVEWMHARSEGWGVTNAYPDPATMGDDRWALLVAARALTTGGSGACVVSCGTAVTIDVLDPDGRHLGGIITPGVGLMRRALTEHTALIQPINDANVVQLASNTPDAVATGTALAAASTVERFYAEARALGGSNMRCIMTGGDAPLVESLVTHPVQLEPDLVLRGLAAMAERAP